MGMGHFKNNHGEICNSVTYIPSSRKSIGSTLDLSSGVRKSSSGVHTVDSAGDARSSNLGVVVRNRLGSSPRRSPHNTPTVSLNTSEYNNTPR